jgi:DNA-binding transcriptional ArsR family regulator
MVEERLNLTFHALADPTRRAMLATLALGEKSIGELAKPFAMTFAGASKHVKVLEDAGLVARRKQGRAHFISVDAKPLRDVELRIRPWEQFWIRSLDRLEMLIEPGHKEENSNG